MALVGNLGVRGAACCCCRGEDITGFYFSKILVLNDIFQLLLKKKGASNFCFQLMSGSGWELVVGSRLDGHRLGQQVPGEGWKP